jgi:hypothetical protein
VRLVCECVARIDTFFDTGTGAGDHAAADAG